MAIRLAQIVKYKKMQLTTIDRLKKAFCPGPLDGGKYSKMVTLKSLSWYNLKRVSHLLRHIGRQCNS